MRMVVGSDDKVAAYIAGATGDQMHHAFRTIGVYDNSGLIGGYAIDHWTGFGCEVSGAGKGIMLRSVRQALCDLVYGYLGCRRMGIIVRKSNKRMQRMATRLGFTVEARLRRYYGTEDGIVYSLLSDEAVNLGHWRPIEKAA